jgi:hypothetical protein
VNAVACALLVLLAVPALPVGASAQGFRLRLDTRAQAVAYRGVLLDSIPVGDTVTGTTGGPATADGFAVSCPPGSAYCDFFRPGALQHGSPFTSTADLLVWGVGLPGLSIHATARLGATLGSADAWPGTEPAGQLLQGYVQYATGRGTLQLGRQTVTSRLGFIGFDGGELTLRSASGRLELAGYGGWGLAQGSALPVTSPELNPLVDFQPAERTLVAGAWGGWTSARADLRVNYQREVDPSVDYFVSERVGFDLAIRPVRGWSLTGGADYDLAAGWWGSAEAALGYTPANGSVTGTVSVKRYRPHFDLWTIWGAFSPVPYRAVDASLSVAPIHMLRLRAYGQRYKFDAADVSTPLTTYETSGWRFSWGATLTPASRWTIDGGYHSEFGPGAASRGFEGAVGFTPIPSFTLGVQAATLDRPLEYRFDDASLTLYGLNAEYRAASRWRVQIDASRYVEDRNRPDASALDWNQIRVSARVVLLLGGSAGSGLTHLPPAVHRVAGGREQR